MDDPDTTQVQEQIAAEYARIRAAKLRLFGNGRSSDPSTLDPEGRASLREEIYAASERIQRLERQLVPSEGR